MARVHRFASNGRYVLGVFDHAIDGQTKHLLFGAGEREYGPRLLDRYRR
jgi:hypothetical protein